ncbi:MAG: hypothetical protein RLZZ393_1897 [Pseudomonadota bacterium]|jgi:hypothetical protein
MYEARHERPLHRRGFVRRLVAHAGAAVALVTGSLCLGMVGYMHYEGLPAVDAFLNAAMLLGGMGPVDVPRSVAGKLFAGAYALYAGLMFLVTAALMFTPVMHRLLHRFHWTEDER